MIPTVPDTINLTLNLLVWQEWPEASISYHFNCKFNFNGNKLKLYPDPLIQFV